VTEGASDEKASGGTAPVFISYASQDVTVANAIVDALERHGVKCWIAPRDVVPGEFYAGAIVHAIDAAKAAVLVLSKNATSSQHVLREVERAAAQRHPVVSFRIDLSPMPADLQYFLNTSHWLDASTSDVERALPKLVEAVQRLVSPVSVMQSGQPFGRAMRPRSALEKPQSRLRISRLVIALSALIAIGLTVFAADKLWLIKHAANERQLATRALAATPTAQAIPARSVAVLPFIDMSERRDQEYFSDGLSEELIDHLSHAKDLKVIARTSSFQFKGKNDDVRTIGQKLGVANLLEGSVRTSGSVIRVTAQLINVADGAHRWSETYDRQIGDIFKLQDDIAAAVVTALTGSLDAEAPARNKAAPNVDAYAAYLQGRELMHNASSKDDLQKASEYFRQAIGIDPTFAEGWMYLLGAVSNQLMAGYVPINVAAKEMRHAAQEVNTLAPESALAHQAAAQIYWTVDWNPPAAAAEYRRAYELNPNDPVVTRQVADMAVILAGDDDSIVKLYQRAVSLDPLSAYTYWSLAEYYLYRGKLNDAQASLAKARAIAPTQPGYDSFLCEVYVVGGERDEALIAARHERDDAARRWATALAYQALGRKREADAALADATQKDGLATPVAIAELHAFRREGTQAFEWLDRAYRSRDFSLLGINADPLLKSLRADPRYRLLLSKLKLPDAWTD
jgi:TolB-like protein